MLLDVELLVLLLLGVNENETLGELEGVEYRDSVAEGDSVTDEALAVYRYDALPELEGVEKKESDAVADSDEPPFPLGDAEGVA